jgi:nucleoside-diphosphate-sugar epimerase
MKILITGASGYVGKSLFNFLNAKHSVTALTRQDVNLTNREEVLNFFKNKFYDVVIHCAVVGGSRLKKDNWDVLDTNLTMYYNLLQCRDFYNKFIHFGSGAELHAKTEPYGLSKLVIQKSILEKENFYNIRIFNVFDENELPTRFIKANLFNYSNELPIVIHCDKKMDFFYMKDFISLVNHYITKDSLPKEIDCTYSKTYTLSEIAYFINNLDNFKSNIIINKRSDLNYCGTYTPLVDNYIGLEKGIQNVFTKIK